MADVKESSELERVKRIIRGLVEKNESNGASEAEALASAEKVGALLQKYDLELSQVMLDGMKNTMTKTKVFAADDAGSSLVVGIGHLCSLVVYRETGTAGFAYVLFGHDVDVELAKYLFEICSEAMESEWVDYGSKHGFTKKQRESFRRGFGGRVHDRMIELKRQRDEERRKHVQMSGCTDLVIVKDQLVQAEFEKEGIRLRSTVRRFSNDSHAYGHGHTAGGKVNLNNPIGDGRGVSGALR
jgi:hypothetical protein